MPKSPPDKRKLTDLLISNLKPRESAYAVWDTMRPHLAVVVQPKTGAKSFKVVYSVGGRPRWYHLGKVRLTDARRLADKILLRVAEGQDPHAERMADRGTGTFEELARRYVEEHARRRNRSWKQAEALVRVHLLPRWGKLSAAAITRADVRAMMSRLAETPATANQTLAAASAVFSWATKMEILLSNPCRSIDRNPTRARSRVLSDSEAARLWPRLPPALRLILCTGQRPSEVAHMRREHIVDGWWWQLPGKPVPELQWPGTKSGRDHRIFLTDLVRPIVEEHLAVRRTRHQMSATMRQLCAEFDIPRLTPHDLRRSALTTLARLGFPRTTLSRIANHSDRSVISIYDRHSYRTEDQRAMEALAAHFVGVDKQHGRSRLPA